MKKTLFIVLFVSCASQTLAQFDQICMVRKDSLRYSFGLGYNLATMGIRDKSITDREDVAIINSLSFISDFNLLQNGYDFLALRLSLNYSWLTNSELSFGNYTFLNKATNETQEMPLKGNFENEAINIGLGLTFVEELSEALFFRVRLINAELNYNRRFNLELISNSNIVAFNPDTKEPHSSSIFNYNDRVNFLVSAGGAISYRLEHENSIFSKMDIEFGVYLKAFHFEEIQHITQYQLRLIFF